MVNPNRILNEALRLLEMIPAASDTLTSDETLEERVANCHAELDNLRKQLDKMGIWQTPDR